MFEGVRGASYKGDISVDDIELKAGSCASSGKNVKKDRCNLRGYDKIVLSAGLLLRFVIQL